MSPDLLFYAVFHEAEALAGVTHRKVIHPAANHRIDQAYDPINRLRLVAAKHILELAKQRRPLFELGRVVGTPYASQTAHPAEVEPHPRLSRLRQLRHARSRHVSLHVFDKTSEIIEFVRKESRLHVRKDEFPRRSFPGLTVEDVQTVDLGVFEQHIDDPR